MGTQPESAPAGAIYTCPMHPQIEQVGPGTCPICGMALEPRTFDPEVPEDDAQLRDMTRRFWVATALALPAFGIAMGDMLPGRPMTAILGEARS